MRPLGYFLLFMVSIGANAALQPLSPAELKSRASHIVEGQVLEVISENDNSSQGKVTKRYRVKLKVSEVIANDRTSRSCDDNPNKSCGSEITADKTIEFSYRQVVHMMLGWGGNTGQSHNIVEGQTIRAYLTAGPDYSLLEHNGFVVESEAK